MTDVPEDAVAYATKLAGCQATDAEIVGALCMAGHCRNVADAVIRDHGEQLVMHRQGARALVRERLFAIAAGEYPKMNGIALSAIIAIAKAHLGYDGSMDEQVRKAIDRAEKLRGSKQKGLRAV